MKAYVKLLHPNAVIPQYAKAGDAGADLVCVEEVMLSPGQATDVATGIAVECPVGFWFDIRPRSSTLRKRGLYVHQGTIDNGYRGPIFVYVRNDNGHPVVIRAGERLAQMVFMPLVRPVLEERDELSPSDRGADGFGSTGA